ncbi:hypothetical protein [Tenggerimyces flavus]|uniref:Uncharacterized protein n=1 Tax=Tenggerimyces flavus TaxID=1708749 RepID=A0ABV7YA57_9ACTN|nr:hypothetical protein [Tenggerimyces flavus]MBM7789058.1 hypothetical protein [Tenggerimyces flavus]
MRRLLALPLVLVATLLGPAVAADPPTSGRVTDVVSLGDSRSERAHDLKANAHAKATEGTVDAGQLTEPYKARTVNQDGRFTFNLRVDKHAPLTLQLREIRPNAEWGKAYGFQVKLDGVLAYVRDERTTETGGGPYTSAFIDTNDEAITKDGKVVVTIEGTSPQATHVTEVWAYSNLERLVTAQGMRTPDRMIFVLGQDHRGEAVYRERLDYLTAKFEETDDVKLGMSVLDYFPNRTPEQMAANYQLWLRLSREYGLPFAIESTSDWEGTPGRIPDGKGGTFGDVKYQQVLWSPQDQTGPDKDVWNGQRLDALLGDRYQPRYGLSVPNIWGNTPWLTWRNEDLNTYLEHKANDSLALVRPLLWDLQSQGESDRLLPFSTTLESTYWSKRAGAGVADNAYTTYNDGVERRDLYADYNPSTVAAAKAEGVVLDPTDGLDEAEKRWMFKNQSYPQQLFADVFYQGLPRERIAVNDDGVAFPRDSLRHNVHSEVYSRKQEPYWDGAHASIAQGIVRHGRPGAEYISLDDYTPGGFSHLQKAREFGRLANPNLENSVSGHAPDKTLLLRQAYVSGSRYTTIYNWQGAGSPDEVTNWVKPFMADLHPYDVVVDGTPDGEASRQASVEFTAGELRLADSIDVRVRRTGAAKPLSLTLLDDAGRTMAVRRLGANEVPTNGWASFGIPVQTLDRGTKYTISVTGENYTFPTVEGQLMHQVGLDMAAQRDRSLVVQWRRDAADAVANVSDDATSQDGLSKATLTAARAALAAHRYVDAYRLAIKADSLRLPVLYQVAAGKRALTPFPVSVNAPGTTDVDVTAFAAGREVSLTVRPRATGTAEIGLSGLGKNPKVTVDGEQVTPTQVNGVPTVRFPVTAGTTKAVQARR